MKSPSGAPGIPAGTIPVAATDEPGSSSDARRFQSTAIANAWRTLRVVERRLAGVEAVVGHRERRIAAQRRAEVAVVGDPAGVDERDRRHVDVARHERVDRALAAEVGEHPHGLIAGCPPSTAGWPSSTNASSVTSLTT